MRTTFLPVALGCCVSMSALADPPVRPVRIVEQPVATQSSKEPVAFFSVLTFGTGDVAASDNDLFSIPADKRLVLEYVSVDTAPTSCVFNLFTSLSLRTGGTALGRDLPVAPSYAGSGGFQRNVMSAPVRLYGDPGSSVRLLLNRSDTSCTSVVTFTGSGFLEDDL